MMKNKNLNLDSRRQRSLEDLFPVPQKDVFGFDRILHNLTRPRSNRPGKVTRRSSLFGDFEEMETGSRRVKITMKQKRKRKVTKTKIKIDIHE